MHSTQPSVSNGYAVTPVHVSVQANTVVLPGIPHLQHGPWVPCSATPMWPYLCSALSSWPCSSTPGTHALQPRTAAIAHRSQARHARSELHLQPNAPRPRALLGDRRAASAAGAAAAGGGWSREVLIARLKKVTRGPAFEPLHTPTSAALKRCSRNPMHAAAYCAALLL